MYVYVFKHLMLGVHIYVLPMVFKLPVYEIMVDVLELKVHIGFYSSVKFVGIVFYCPYIFVSVSVYVCVFVCQSLRLCMRENNPSLSLSHPLIA